MVLTLCRLEAYQPEKTYNIRYRGINSMIENYVFHRAVSYLPDIVIAWKQICSEGRRISEK